MKLDNGYLVMVEQSLSFDAMLDALKHELRHIILGHLDDDCKTEHEMEMEVRESDVIYIVDRGECRKKIYSVS
jgi:predicted metal-dependent peptidase